MTALEILIGLGIGLAILGGAVYYALRSSDLIGPPRHDVRSGGDYATPQNARGDGFDAGSGDSD